MFVVVSAALYVYKAKMSGQTCIGCPNAKKPLKKSKKKEKSKKSGCFSLKTR